MWEFKRERYSDLYLKDGYCSMAALEMAERYGKDEVAALLLSLVTL